MPREGFYPRGRPLLANKESGILVDVLAWSAWVMVRDLCCKVVKPGLGGEPDLGLGCCVCIRWLQSQATITQCLKAVHTYYLTGIVWGSEVGTETGGRNGSHWAKLQVLAGLHSSWRL